MNSIYMSKLPSVNVSFIDISFSVPKLERDFYIWHHKSGSKTILNKVSGEFRAGELSAIMGPSGSGKSTLINILAGYRRKDVFGTVLVNNSERNLKQFREMSCYIMQDDCLMSHVSVKESMMVAAALKLSRKISLEEKNLIVMDILTAIGLSHVTKTNTERLSGGQRKRLAIALELIGNPPIMFCDEPTSGLDSSSSFQLLSMLEKLTNDGRTIVCTIHQPSARLFEKFNYLYMLAEGRCIYQGEMDSLVPFLKSLGFTCPAYHNPADYVSEVANNEHGPAVKILADAISALVEKPGIIPFARGIHDLDPKHPRTGHRKFLFQFWILLKRSFKFSLRDKQLMKIRLAAHVLVFFLVLAIYHDAGDNSTTYYDNLGFIFFTILFSAFTGMMPTILTFPQQMGSVIREHLNYWYSFRAFYLAKIVVDIPFQILFNGVFALAVYYATSQPNEFYRMVRFINISMLTSLVAQSLGLLVGARFSIETGVFLGPIANIPILLFSGFLVTFRTIPWYLKWATYVGYGRYGFEGAVLAIFQDRNEYCTGEIGQCTFSSTNAILIHLGMNESQYWVDVVVLIGMLVALRLVTYYVLYVKICSIQ